MPLDVFLAFERERRLPRQSLPHRARIPSSGLGKYAQPLESGLDCESLGIKKGRTATARATDGLLERPILGEKWYSHLNGIELVPLYFEVRDGVMKLRGPIQHSRTRTNINIPRGSHKNNTTLADASFSPVPSPAAGFRGP